MTCDESLYRQYLSGDDEGLKALMKKYGDPLTLYIDGYLHDVHEAEELMLDVFAYLFTKKPRIRDGGFKAYLYKAARHMALRHKSKRKPLFSLDALADEPDGRLLAEEVIRTEERNRILHFCMDEMNPDYREVLYLTYFEDMSYAQAAEVTGKTVKQITNMVYRGKESLRRLLEREGITNPHTFSEISKIFAAMAGVSGIGAKKWVDGRVDGDPLGKPASPCAPGVSAGSHRVDMGGFEQNGSSKCTKKAPFGAFFKRTHFQVFTIRFFPHFGQVNSTVPTLRGTRQ